MNQEIVTLEHSKPGLCRTVGYLSSSSGSVAGTFPKIIVSAAESKQAQPQRSLHPATSVRMQGGLSSYAKFKYNTSHFRTKWFINSINWRYSK